MKKIFAPTKITKIQKAAIVVACVGFFGILIYMKIKPDLPVFMKTNATVTVEDGGAIIELKDETKEDIEKHMPDDLTDMEIAGFIHRMSHAKVVAEEKWGYEPITMKRIVRLIDVIEANKDNIKHHGTYLRILNKWRDNDFSQADYDHNSVWSIQSGTVGRATGILSFEEEMEFIKQYYDVNE
jgi:hypothetical protein